MSLLDKLLTQENKKEQYENLVVVEIRKRYSQNEENAILRKKLANIDDGEFEVYNTYVESIKARLKQEWLED